MAEAKVGPEQLAGYAYFIFSPTRAMDLVHARIPMLNSLQNPTMDEQTHAKVVDCDGAYIQASTFVSAVKNAVTTEQTNPLQFRPALPVMARVEATFSHELSQMDPKAFYRDYYTAVTAEHATKEDVLAARADVLNYLAFVRGIHYFQDQSQHTPSIRLTSRLLDQLPDAAQMEEFERVFQKLEGARMRRGFADVEEQQTLSLPQTKTTNRPATLHDVLNETGAFQ